MQRLRRARSGEERYFDFMNTNNSILVNKKLSTRSTIFIIIITAVFIVVLNSIGEREPVVNVFDDRVEIKAMFGTTIDKDNIVGISLLDKSMKEIGIGTRTNGYGGLTGTYRGLFKASDKSDMLVFARASSVPTIQIQTKNGPPVFINFRNSDKTTELFYEISEKLGIPISLADFNNKWAS